MCFEHEHAFSACWCAWPARLTYLTLLGANSTLHNIPDVFKDSIISTLEHITSPWIMCLDFALTCGWQWTHLSFISTCVPAERLNNWYVVCYSCQRLTSCTLVMISAQQGVLNSTKGTDFIALIHLNGTNGVVLYKTINKHCFPCLNVNGKDIKKEIL